MDRDFGEWYLECKIQCDHDLLQRRWQGIEHFTKDLNYKGILELARIFYQMPTSAADFDQNFRAALQKADSAFRMQDNDLELALLSGATLISTLMPRNKDIASLAAFSLVCPNFMKKGKAPAVHSIVVRARDFLVKRSAGLRTPKDHKRVLSATGELTELTEQFISVLKTGDISNAADKMAEYFNKLTTVFGKCVESANKIQKQQLLYQEETDILWWLMAEYSRDFNKRASGIDIPVACLIAGKELADLTRILPGPFSSRAFLDKFLRSIQYDFNNPVKFPQAINQADRDWRRKWVRDQKDNDAIDLCPTMFAVQKSLEGQKESDWYVPFKSTTGYNSKISLAALDLATQVYEESLFLRLVKNERSK